MVAPCLYRADPNYCCEGIALYPQMLHLALGIPPLPRYVDVTTLQPDTLTSMQTTCVGRTVCRLNVVPAESFRSRVRDCRSCEGACHCSLGTGSSCEVTLRTHSVACKWPPHLYYPDTCPHVQRRLSTPEFKPAR